MDEGSKQSAKALFSSPKKTKKKLFKIFHYIESCDTYIKH